MGLFKDVRGLMKDSKDLKRPSLSEGIAQAREGVAIAKEQQAAAQGEGIDGEATIKAIRDTGMTINENPVAELDLEVESGGGPPYPVTAKWAIPQLQLGQIQPGATVEVMIDPDDPSKVTLA